MRSTDVATPMIKSIDDHLLELRQTQTSHEYQRRLLEGIDGVSSVTTLRVLRSIERAAAEGHSPSIRDIAEDLDIEQSTASRSAHLTTQLGLTERRPCANDQRRVLLSLTDDGWAASNRATENRREMVAAAVADWSDDDLERFNDLFGRLASGLTRERTSQA